MVRIRADGPSLRKALRRREIDAVFRNVPPDAFDETLELGAGDGAQSRLIAQYARKVVSTDIDPNRLIPELHTKVIYATCDAAHLPFKASRFDLVYSSNLLEHLPQPASALSEMHRVLKDDGVVVHVVPNRLWKTLQLALFVPNQLLTIAEILISRERRKAVGTVEFCNNPQHPPPSFLVRNIWPQVHGESPTHVTEFLHMGASYWERLFSESGFQLAGRIQGLPIHSPYQFGFEAPRRLLESLGFSSTNGYVLNKIGQSPDGVSLFS